MHPYTISQNHSILVTADLDPDRFTYVEPSLIFGLAGPEVNRPKFRTVVVLENVPGSVYADRNESARSLCRGINQVEPQRAEFRGAAGGRLGKCQHGLSIFQCLADPLAQRAARRRCFSVNRTEDKWP